MFSDADGELTNIEKMMLDTLQNEYAVDEESERPAPVSLVMLMEKTHKTILARLSKRGGFNMSEMMKNPEQSLVMLDRYRELLIKMMAQRDMAAIGAAVVPFPKHEVS